jgi:hypothetical protein
VLTALGVLVATAVAVIVLALTSATNTTVATPVTASDTGGVSAHGIHYLGPRQLQAAALSASSGATHAAHPGK